MEQNPPPLSASREGLCATCTHARRIKSDKGSIFIQCGLAFKDPDFPKYPRLPVISCAGYTRRADFAEN